jgi:hypothetical protein
MTTPNSMQFLDQNNPLLASGPARLDGGTIEFPQVGTLGVLSMRTASATVTAMLTADELHTWARFVDALADQVGGGRLQAATAMDVAALDPTMKRRNT